MKLKSTHLIGGFLAAACAFTQVQGAPTSSQELAPMTIQGNAPRTPKVNGEVDSPKNSFSELIEIEVLNFQNEKLGRVKAITADLEQGRLVEVLIGTRSGMLGMNETLTPVPPSSLMIDARHEIARINVSKARFDAAPKLPRSNAAFYSQQDRAIASSRYFGVAQPWFARTGLGYVQTTADLELMQIKNMQGQYMGKVGLVLMDLPTSRIRQIVDDTESMDGSGSHFLRPEALHYNAKRNGLVLNNTFAGLNNNAAHFRWVHGNGGDNHYVQELNAGQAAPTVPVVQTRQIVHSKPITVRKAIVVTKPATQNSRTASKSSSTMKDLAAE